ncbi:MAG: Sec-independent protein translocase subunit TatA/TatB [Dethiobacteraceae bacterium]|jgi:sec-independent protein translocase protein TatA|nr:twin-arginine translocase TatA/TatE family subunit [Bacillota bacterium]
MTKLGFWEIILILFVVLMVFGPNKLPEVGRSLGKGIREFKKASKEITDSIKDESCEVEQT